MPDAIDDTDDDIPAEIDFSGGQRGRRLRPGAVLRLPVYLDAEVHRYSQGTEMTLDALLNELTGALRARLGSRFAGLWLYGSYARGDAGPESDIDVVLLLRGMERPGQEIDRIADILAELNLKHGVLISVLPIEEGDLGRFDGPFWRNVRRDGRAA